MRTLRARRHALVVHVERAAPVGDGAVVDHRHELRGDLLAEPPEKAEVCLRLKSPSSPWPTASCSRMPGQPGPSTTVSVARGRVHRAELHHRLAHRLGREALPAIALEEEVEARTRPPPP